MKIFSVLNLALTRPKFNRCSRQHLRCLSISRQLELPCRHIGEQTEATTKSDVSFKIVEEGNDFIKKHQAAGSNVELADLECTLNGGQRLVLNLTWLRDSCHCERCTHKFSRQRLFTPKDFRKELFGVEGVQVVTSKVVKAGAHSGYKDDTHSYLNINWSDGHESFYSLSWLGDLQNLYIEPRLRSGAVPKNRHLLPNDDFYAPHLSYAVKEQYWSVDDLRMHLRPVDYDDLLDGFEFHEDDPNFINANRVSDMSSRRFNSILSLTDQLTRFGLAKIVNVSEERDQVLRVARSLAYERPTGYGTIFDVVIEPSEEINLAYSPLEFDLHSDLTYREKSPGVQLLHCISNSVDGGLSYFADAFQAANVLRHEEPILFNVLTQIPVVFVVRDPYRDMKFRRQKPVITLNYAGELHEVYYSPFMLPPVAHKDDLKLFYLAQDKFTQLLQADTNKLLTKMNAGDLFIFNNRRVLHGRSSYDPKTSNRFLQGCYMDWDEIICLHEKFLSNKS